MRQEINPADEGYNLWKSIGFFNDEHHIVFAFKKAERIASALYLVSGLLKDTEPLKWELRERGVSLLSSAMSLNSLEPGDKNMLMQSFFADSLETISLLSVAKLAGLVSEMNYTVLKKEIEAVVALLKIKVFEDAAKAGYVLSDSFFKTDLSIKDEKNESISGQALISKTHQSSQKSDTRHQQKGNVHIKDKIAIKDKKDSRRTMIVALLKKKSNLTIKDFSQEIQGCSEKTIQRELLELVAKGLVKKEGERRWSKYSLV